ncbi:hypothetical protein D3C86_512170 [compost metagenome]
MPAQAFGQAPGVDENQRGAVRARKFREPVVDPFPDIIGHDGRQGHWRHLNTQIPWPGVANVNNFAGTVVADEKLRHGFHRFLRGGQAYAGQRFAA